MKQKAIKRFITMLAFYNEAHPSPNTKVNQYWAKIRNLPHNKYCLKYGKCEICGEEDLLVETGLNWTCENPDCLKEMENSYKKLIDALQKEEDKESGEF